MDVQRFDTLIRSLTTATLRRGLLAGLTAGLLGARSLAIGVVDVDAKKHGKGKKKRKNKKRKDRDVTRADATCAANPGTVNIGGSDNERIAQTFTATASGPLLRAELVITKVLESNGDFILQLGAVDAFGVPTNEVLAFTSVANASVPAGKSALSFSFANPETVAAGTQHALVLTRPGSDILAWHGQGGDTCAGQAFISPDQTAPFGFDTVGNGFDLNFTAFVRS